MSREVSRRTMLASAAAAAVPTLAGCPGNVDSVLSDGSNGGGPVAYVAPRAVGSGDGSDGGGAFVRFDDPEVTLTDALGGETALDEQGLQASEHDHWNRTWVVTDGASTTRPDEAVRSDAEAPATGGRWVRVPRIEFADGAVVAYQTVPLVGDTGQFGDGELPRRAFPTAEAYTRDADYLQESGLPQPLPDDESFPESPKRYPSVATAQRRTYYSRDLLGRTFDVPANVVPAHVAFRHPYYARVRELENQKLLAVRQLAKQFGSSEDIADEYGQAMGTLRLMIREVVGQLEPTGAFNLTVGLATNNASKIRNVAVSESLDAAEALTDEIGDGSAALGLTRALWTTVSVLNFASSLGDQGELLTQQAVDLADEGNDYVRDDWRKHFRPGTQDLRRFQRGPEWTDGLADTQLRSASAVVGHVAGRVDAAPRATLFEAADEDGAFAAAAQRYRDTESYREALETQRAGLYRLLAGMQVNGDMLLGRHQLYRTPDFGPKTYVPDPAYCEMTGDYAPMFGLQTVEVTDDDRLSVKGHGDGTPEEITPQQRQSAADFLRPETDLGSLSEQEKQLNALDSSVMSGTVPERAECTGRKTGEIDTGLQWLDRPQQRAEGVTAGKIAIRVIAAATLIERALSTVETQLSLHRAVVTQSVGPEQEVSVPQSMLRSGTPAFRADPANTGLVPTESGPVESPAIDQIAPLEGSVVSSPAVVDGSLYVGDGAGYVYAFDLGSGERLWRTPAGAESGERVWSSPAVADGTVYVGSHDGRLYALDAETGDPEWTHETDDYVLSPPTVVDGTVYLGGGDGRVRAVETDGTEAWTTDDLGAEVDSSPAVVDGSVYVATQGAGAFALDAGTGDPEWTYEIPNGSVSSPAVADGAIYVGDGAGYVHCVDAATGDRCWRFETAGEVISSPALADGLVYIGSNDGHLYGLAQADGKQAFATAADPLVESAPLVGGHAVYVGGADTSDEGGAVHAYERATGERLWSVDTGGPFADLVGADTTSFFSSPALADGSLYIAGQSGESAGSESGVYEVSPSAGSGLGVGSL